MLTVLSIGYPFAPVSADPVGGAEQVLAALDRALAGARYRSLVIAPEGSQAAGELVPIPAVVGPIDHAVRDRVHASVREATARVLADMSVDVVHLHGVDFDAYLPPRGTPALATLHLPIAWYGAAALQSGLTLVPVSDDQAARAPDGVRLTEPIPNGVDLDLYRPGTSKADYVLILGRVAPEKGFPDAFDAAERAGVPLRAAGDIFPYPTHQQHFAEAVVPRLDADRLWLGPVAGEEKRRLLAEARCLLVPSTAPETSSLVAMEALASGTPVIAYRSGALPEIVEDGVTGFIVDDVEEMAGAILRVGGIDPVACRTAAEARFPLARTTEAYLALYERLAT